MYINCCSLLRKVISKFTWKNVAVSYRPETVFSATTALSWFRFRLFYRFRSTILTSWFDKSLRLVIVSPRIQPPISKSTNVCQNLQEKFNYLCPNWMFQVLCKQDELSATQVDSTRPEPNRTSRNRLQSCRFVILKWDLKRLSQQQSEHCLTSRPGKQLRRSDWRSNHYIPALRSW